MLAFAANSLLARGALGGGGMDAASFTAIRLISGAVALAVLLTLQRGRAIWLRPPGNWVSAACLFAYAIGFSLAYLRLGAATGALILFAAVQASMIGWGAFRGQHPGRRELVGLAIAFAAFVWLLLPGLHAPDPLGAVLMMAAGVAWGAYSLRGRMAGPPLEETAGNFLRTVPVCVLLGLVGGHADGRGVVLALLSGIVGSGLGYAIWYRALPLLRPMAAASVQLTVPLIAALGAVVFLSEALTFRLAAAGLCILGGVGLTIMVRRSVKS
jgi:drug/metabolite transporter (DMT)-like permease